MRKKLIAAFVVMAFAILAPAHPAGAQQAGNMPRIGFLASGSAETNAAFAHAFSEGLREHGWVEGQNIAIEYRWAEGKLDRLPQLAAELVRLQVEVIFATNTPAVVAVKQTGTKIPVVFAAVSEPIEIGAVASLARPGGNFTGLTTMNRELMPKRLELLKEALPGLTRVGYLANPTYAGHQPQLHEMQAAARSLGLELHLFEVREGSELERAFAGMAAAHVGAFIVQQDVLFGAHRRTIIDLAAQSRLPGMYPGSVYPDDGGLISYAAHIEDLCRCTATYVDKILQGAQPANLPVERPMKFELVINLKTAQALGLTIPRSSSSRRIR
jgi:putative tryptophan/tyrosine transport system substrate-binding protein